MAIAWFLIRSRTRGMASRTNLGHIVDDPRNKAIVVRGQQIAPFVAMPSPNGSAGPPKDAATNPLRLNR